MSSRISRLKFAPKQLNEFYQEKNGKEFCVNEQTWMALCLPDATAVSGWCPPRASSGGLEARARGLWARG